MSRSHRFLSRSDHRSGAHGPRPYDRPGASARIPRLSLPAGRLSLLVALGLLVSATGCHDHSTEPGWHESVATTELTWAEDAIGVGTLGVEVTSGSITLTTGPSDRIFAHVHVEVRADSRRTAEEIAADVQIRADRVGASLRMHAEPPHLPRGTRLETRWDVEIPEGLDLELYAVNGGIDVDGRYGTLKAGTENGTMIVRGTAGSLQLVSVNGTLDADLDRLDGSSSFSTVNGRQDLAFAAGNPSIRATTVNGTVSLTLPYVYSGWLDASVTNGGVSCDIPLTETEEYTSTRIRGQLGEGGPRVVELRAVNGGIQIHRYRH